MSVGPIRATTAPAIATRATAAKPAPATTMAGDELALSRNVGRPAITQEQYAWRLFRHRLAEGGALAVGGGAALAGGLGALGVLPPVVAAVALGLGVAAVAGGGYLIWTGIQRVRDAKRQLEGTDV